MPAVPRMYPRSRLSLPTLEAHERCTPSAAFAMPPPLPRVTHRHRLAFTRYCQYEYQYCMLTERNRGVGKKPCIAQYRLQNIDGAMKEEFSAKNSSDSCTIPE